MSKHNCYADYWHWLSAPVVASQTQPCCRNFRTLQGDCKLNTALSSGFRKFGVHGSQTLRIDRPPGPTVQVDLIPKKTRQFSHLLGAISTKNSREQD